MQWLNARAFILAFISFLILVCAPQAAAQANTTPEPVKVVNTTKNPVPTVAQGTTKISGNVNVTNSSIPVTGSVSITNNSLPVNVTNSSLAVTGTVSVEMSAPVWPRIPLSISFNRSSEDPATRSTTSRLTFARVAAPLLRVFSTPIAAKDTRYWQYLRSPSGLTEYRA